MKNNHKTKCPVCQVLRGEKYRPKKKVCRDCAENKQVGILWQEYETLELVLQTQNMYIYFFPPIIIASQALMWLRSKSFGQVSVTITVFGVWVFNLYYLWPKNKMRKRDILAKLAVVKDKMTIAKIAGNTSPGESSPSI